MRYLLLLFVILASCSSNRSLAGGSTDTELGSTNAVGVVISSADNTAEKGAIVSAIPSDFNPLIDDSSSVIKDTTDEFGKFELTIIDTVFYNIIVRNDRENSGAMLYGEEIKINGSENTPTTNIDTLFTRDLHTIKIELPQSTTGQYFIEGTDIISSTIDSKTVNISSVPYGKYGSIKKMVTGVEFSSTLIDSIAIIADTTVTVTLDSLPTKKILYIYNENNVIGDQGDSLIEYLRLSFYVSPINLTSVKSINTSEYDLIYFDRFIDNFIDTSGSDLNSLFLKISLPTILGSGHLLEEYHLISKYDNGGTTESKLQLSKNHSINQDIFADKSEIFVVKDSSAVSIIWFTPINSAELLLQDTTNVFSATFDIGITLSNDEILSTRRVALPEIAKDLVFSDELENLIKASIIWALLPNE